MELPSMDKLDGYPTIEQLENFETQDLHTMFDSAQSVLTSDNPTVTEHDIKEAAELLYNIGIMLAAREVTAEILKKLG